MTNKINVLKEFINSAKAFFAAIERDGGEIERRYQESKQEFYKRNGIYFRGGF